VRSTRMVLGIRKKDPVLVQRNLVIAASCCTACFSREFSSLETIHWHELPRFSDYRVPIDDLV
jgi:hypothetical protein